MNNINIDVSSLEEISNTLNQISTQLSNINSTNNWFDGIINNAITSIGVFSDLSSILSVLSNKEIMLQMSELALNNELGNTTAELIKNTAAWISQVAQTTAATIATFVNQGTVP